VFHEFLNRPVDPYADDIEDTEKAKKIEKYPVSNVSRVAFNISSGIESMPEGDIRPLAGGNGEKTPSTLAK
jgi:hypothetical protein